MKKLLLFNFANNVNLQRTSSKLNGINYMLWAQSVKVFLGTRRKLKFITRDLHSKTSDGYDEWWQDNYLVMT